MLLTGSMAAVSTQAFIRVKVVTRVDFKKHKPTGQTIVRPASKVNSVILDNGKTSKEISLSKYTMVVQ